MYILTSGILQVNRIKNGEEFSTRMFRMTRANLVIMTVYNWVSSWDSGTDRFKEIRSATMNIFRFFLFSF